MTEKINVAIVDDNNYFVENTIQHLAQFEDLNINIIASNGQELINALLKEPKPKVILLDLDMPVMDGIKTTEYLHEKYPEIKILILTVHNDEGVSNQLIQKGVHGFLLKDGNINQISEAIYAVTKYDYCFKGWNLKSIISAKNIKINTAFVNEMKFKERELEIIRLICEQNTSQEIAEKLFISKRTADGHRDKIFQKANVRNIAGLALYAVRNKIITLNNDRE